MSVGADRPAGYERRWRGPVWILGLLALGIAGGLGLFWVAGNLAGRGLEALAGAFKPSVSYTTILAGTIGRLREESKLVVLTAEVTAEVVKESHKVQEVFGYPVDLGTTTVRVRARENRVQFFVPLERIGKGDFAFDRKAKRLVVTVSAPVLDEAVVEVQSDPSKIELETRVGWARLDSRSGQALRVQAQQTLRPAVLAAARSELLADKAAASAREALKRLLRPLSEALADGVELTIEFTPEQRQSSSR